MKITIYYMDGPSPVHLEAENVIFLVPGGRIIKVSLPGDAAPRTFTNVVRVEVSI